MPDRIRILYIAPGKTPEVRETDTTIESLQNLVGGLIQAVYPWDDPVAIVCNDEGKIAGMEPNRVIEDEDGEAVDLIVGPFFICGIGEEEFASVREDLIPKYEALFHSPEVFFRLSDGHVYYMKTEGDSPKMLV